MTFAKMKAELQRHKKTAEETEYQFTEHELISNELEKVEECEKIVMEAIDKMIKEDDWDEKTPRDYIEGHENALRRLRKEILD